MTIMDKENVDSYGLPLGRLNSYKNNNCFYMILPMDNLEERIYSGRLLPTYYAVFKFSEVGVQQVSKWYYRYGNAVKKMLSM